MQIKDYFTFQFKKPSLGEEEKSREEKKDKLKKDMESAYSRLESIEILNSNSKTQDVFLILKSFLVDLYNITASYYGKKPVSLPEEVSSSLDQIPNSTIQDFFKEKDRLLSIHTISQPTEEETELMEEQASKLLMSLEKHFKKLQKSELHTPMDDFKKRWTIQGSVLVSLLAISIGSVVYNKIKYPVFHDDNAQIYYLTKDLPNPSEERSVKVPVTVENKGVWKEYNFSLANPEALIGIRIDPINQRKIRFGLSHVRYLDSNGKILSERDFELTENLIPKDIEQISMLNDLKAGKAVPGGFAEMVSTGSDPFFHLGLPSGKPVSTIQIRMRVMEEYLKFPE